MEKGFNPTEHMVDGAGKKDSFITHEAHRSQMLAEIIGMVKRENGIRENGIDVQNEEALDFNTAIEKAKNPADFQKLPEKFRNNKEFVLTTLQKGWSSTGDILRYVPAELRNNKEIIMAAVKLDGTYITYASESLRDDEDVVSLAMKTFSMAVADASPRIKSEILKHLDEREQKDEQRSWAEFNKEHPVFEG